MKDEHNYVRTMMENMHQDIKDERRRRKVEKYKDKRHGEILEIQKRQIKILEHQNKFTKILALGTIILATATFLQFFSLDKIVLSDFMGPKIAGIVLLAISFLGYFMMATAFIILLILFFTYSSKTLK